MIPTRLRYIIAASLLCAGCANNTVSFYAENDSLTYGPPTDANYTNGLRLSIEPKNPYEPCDSGGHEFPDDPCEVEHWYKKIINSLNFLRTQASVTEEQPFNYPIWLEYGLGQQMYTPDDISVDVVQPLDRPYGGWLYGFLQIHNDRTLSRDTAESWERDRRLTVTLKSGIVGPSSHADAIQKYWHDERCDCTHPNGWHLQIRDEPGFVLATAREDRLWVGFISEQWRTDVLWRGELSIGNVYTGADLGGTLRLGYNLPRSFSPVTMGPQVIHAPGSYAGNFEQFRLYGFIGVIGRAVARDIFLDGGVFKDSPHTVDREPFQAEGQVGFGVHYGRWSVKLLYAHRSKQFETQEKGHRFGSIVITSRYK